MLNAPRWISASLIHIGLLLTVVFAFLLTADLATAGDDLLETFEQTHAEIIAQVKKGKLSAEVGAKADEMRIALKKYLIKTEAQMEILQLDVLYGSGEKQETSLRKLLALSAAQERTKVVYLQRLQALKAGKTKGGELVPPLPPAPEQSKADPSDETSGEKTAKKKKERDIIIEIGPEEVDSGRP
jgi:hypothetical protein